MKNLSFQNLSTSRLYKNKLITSPSILNSGNSFNISTDALYEFSIVTRMYTGPHPNKKSKKIISIRLTKRISRLLTNKVGFDGAIRRREV